MAPPHSAAISSDQNSERDMPPLDPTFFKQALPRQQRRSLYRPRSPGQCFIRVCCCFSSYRLSKKAWLPIEDNHIDIAIHAHSISQQ